MNEWIYNNNPAQSLNQLLGVRQKVFNMRFHLSTHWRGVGGNLPMQIIMAILTSHYQKRRHKWVICVSLGMRKRSISLFRLVLKYAQDSCLSPGVVVAFLKSVTNQLIKKVTKQPTWYFHTIFSCYLQLWSYLFFNTLDLLQLQCTYK